MLPPLSLLFLFSRCISLQKCRFSRNGLVNFYINVSRHSYAIFISIYLFNIDFNTISDFYVLKLINERFFFGTSRNVLWFVFNNFQMYRSSCMIRPFVCLARQGSDLRPSHIDLDRVRHSSMSSDAYQKIVK